MPLSPEQLFAPPERAAETPSQAAEPCPKCGKNLIDPGGLGWCSGCGYCKSLDDAAANKLLQAKKPAPVERVIDAGGGAVTTIPVWLCASPIFLAAGVLFGLYMDTRLPTGDNLQRALWATLLVAGGALTILLGQVAALFVVAPEEPTLSFKDALIPMKLWPLALRRMPRLQGSLWAALLGVGLIVGSAVFIGGFQHWFTYMPQSASEKDKAAPASSGRGEPVILNVD